MKRMILDDGTSLSIAWRLKQKRLQFLKEQTKKEMLMGIESVNKCYLWFLKYYFRIQHFRLAVHRGDTNNMTRVLGEEKYLKMVSYLFDTCLKSVSSPKAGVTLLVSPQCADWLRLRSFSTFSLHGILLNSFLNFCRHTKIIMMKTHVKEM